MTALAQAPAGAAHETGDFGPHEAGLGDLDDAVLVNIFGRLSPLPDLFAACSVSKRFRRLGGDGRLWLRVAGLGKVTQGAQGHRKLSFETLNEAVMASRPGDTIQLAPGVMHFVQDVSVDWPLRLLGGGSAAEETVLTSLLGASSAVTFRASGILANLAINSEQHACVTHCRGRLTVDGCALHALPAAGLEHLFSPLVTLAASPPRPSRGLKLQSKGLPYSAGVLSVKETKIKGKDGMRAVKAAGTGSLAGVRAIPLEAETLFWFTVDSAGGPRGRLPALGGVSQLPGWARGGQPLFPEDSVRQASSEQLRRKSEAWSQEAGRCIKPRLL